MHAPVTPRRSRQAVRTGHAGPPHRTGHLLRAWWPHRKEDTAPTRSEQLYALLAVLEDGMAAQSVASRVVAACERPGPVSDAVARTADEQIAGYHQLNVRLHQLPVDAVGLDELTRRAGRLFASNQWILHQAVTLMSAAIGPDARVEAARQRLHGLGRPGDGLRQLRDEVRDLAERAREQETAT
ncbi:hypothetical protein [Actinocorallia cavernae]